MLVIFDPSHFGVRVHTTSDGEVDNFVHNKHLCYIISVLSSALSMYIPAYLCIMSIETVHTSPQRAPSTCMADAVRLTQSNDISTMCRKRRHISNQKLKSYPKLLAVEETVGGDGLLNTDRPSRCLSSGRTAKGTGTGSWAEAEGRS